MTDEFPTPDEDPQNPEPSPRRGRARERQQRRRARQQQVQPRLPTHLVPERALKLPTLRIPRRARLIVGVLASLGVIVVVILFLRELKPQQTSVQPHALWIGTEWTYAEQDADSINSLVSLLRQNQIGTVYAWVSYLQQDRTWRGAENFALVRQFASQLKTADPDLKLYGWISYPADMDDDGYRLDDEELRQNVADFSGSVVNELGYDGVFLNVEPVWDGDEQFLALLRDVRTSIGDSAFLSVAVPPDWSPENAGIPVPPLIVPGTVWSSDYKKNVALLANQLTVMAYNSGLATPEDYSQWLAYQVQVYAKAINDIGGGTSLMIGIPSYEAEPPGHDPQVENVQSALRGVTSGLAQAGDAASVVQGVAIYAGWTTDEDEWAQFAAWLHGS